MEEINRPVPPRIDSLNDVQTGAIVPGTPPPPPPSTPWGLWATIGWTFLIAFCYLSAQMLVVGVWFAIQRALGNDLPDRKLVQTDGLLLAVTTTLTNPVAIVLCIVFAWLRRGIRLKDYLGWRWPRIKTLLFWCAFVTVLNFTIDWLTVMMGRPATPNVMVEIYRRAGYLPLLWFAMIVAAPIAEEMVFRGFLFTGLWRSRAGPVAAVLLTSAAWAVIHVQYDLWGITVILLLGITLGLVRIKTDSLPLCMVLHAFNNLVATIQVAQHVY